MSLEAADSAALPTNGANLQFIEPAPVSHKFYGLRKRGDFFANEKPETHPRMKTSKMLLTILAWTLPLAGAMAQPFVTNRTTSVYAVVPDPMTLSFGADGALYVGRDDSGSGGTGFGTVKIHRVAPGGGTVTEFGDTGISDPDALIVDLTGAVSGTPGAVLVGGIHNNGNTGKIVKIAPDGTVTTLFGPSATWWNPSNFAFDLSGRLLFTDFNGGRVLATTGNTPTILFTLAGVPYLAVDALGRIAVSTSSSSQLRLYTSDGVLINANFATVKPHSPVVRGPGGEWGTDLYAVAPNGDLIRIGLDGTTTIVGGRFVMASGAVFYGMTFGPDGAFYVSDFEADRIYRFGRPEVPGTQTTVYARVTDPMQLAFAPDGTLFVGRDNTGSGGDYDDAVKVHRVGPGGSPVEEYGAAAITDPDAVIYDANGSASGIPGAVLVAGHDLNSPGGKIVAIRPDQSLTNLYSTGAIFNPNVFTCDLNGRLLFSDNEGGKVWTMTNGAPTVLFNLAGALHLAVDELNRLVVGREDLASLHLYTAGGVLLTNAFATVAPNSPLARGPGGFWGTGIFCVNTNGDLISLDTNGVATRFGTGFGLPSGMAFGPDGALYLSEFDSDLIWRVAPPNCFPQPAGLVSWWPGNGNPEDVVGLNNAVAMGGLGYADGMVAQAFDLNGSSAFAQVVAPAGLPLGNAPRTLALWLKTPRNLSSETESALFQYGSDADGQMFGLITSANAPGRLYFFGYSRDVAGNTVLAPETWYHAAVTYDGTTATLYLNGQPDGSRSVELNTALNANGVTIGYRPGSARWLGQLDEVMLFDRALAPNEIAAMYAAGSAGVCQPRRLHLSISRQNGVVIVSWPASADGWVLEATNALPSLPAPWPQIPPPYQANGPNLQFIEPAPVGHRFFRLHRP